MPAFFLSVSRPWAVYVFDHSAGSLLKIRMIGGGRMKESSRDSAGDKKHESK